jgi:hypothetical protein
MTQRAWRILPGKNTQTTLQEGLAATYGWIREEICGW